MFYWLLELFEKEDSRDSETGPQCNYEIAVVAPSECFDADRAASRAEVDCICKAQRSLFR